MTLRAKRTKWLLCRNAITRAVCRLEIVIWFKTAQLLCLLLKNVSSGTGYTVRYAEQQGLIVLNVAN